MSAAKSTRKLATSSTDKASSEFTEEIDAIIRNSDDWRGETLSRLRGIILGAGPAVVEEVKWKKPSRPEGVPVWSLDGIVCTGEMLKNAALHARKQWSWPPYCHSLRAASPGHNRHPIPAAPHRERPRSASSIRR
jgi:hypothetical protein